MAETFIIYGICISLVGMFFSSVIALFKNSFKAGNGVLLFSALIGFLSGCLYLFNFSGQEPVIVQLDILLNFKLELNFLAGVFFTLITGISSLVLIYSGEYLKRYQKIYGIGKVQFLTSLFILGMAGAVLVDNALGFMVFWETMSIASFFLVMSDKTKESARAAFIYFVMTHLGAAAILGGFLVLSNGSLIFGFSDIAIAAKNISPAMQTLALLLFFFGFGSKAGLVPFHIWLPEAHPQAPTNISALMSGLMLKIAVYGFLRTVFSFPAPPLWFAELVIALGVGSAFFGALYAAIERDIKKALAYSSIENMGIIFAILGVSLYVLTKSLAPETTILAALLVSFAIFHALNHAVFKTALFLSAGVIINRIHSRSLEAMGGLAKLMPIFSLVFLIVILGASALPPFGAFYSEWGFIQTLIRLLGIFDFDASTSAIFFALLPLFVLASALAIFAMIKIFGISMLGLPRTKLRAEDADKSDFLLIAPIAILSLVILLLGIFAKDILDALSQGWEQTAYARTNNPLGVAIFSEKVFAIFILFFGMAFAFYKLFSKNNSRERKYQTWDCGQPIDASMEYTATAFSAPIRFFFLPLLRRSKDIVSVPIIATNPWLVKKSFSLRIASTWQEKFYKPASKTVFWLADKIRLIHTGRIQYYLLLFLATVIITLMIAL